jgi:Putative adhesin
MSIQRRWSGLLAGVGSLLLAAGPLAAETVTVPLSDPTRPAKIEADLVNGGITVEAWNGKEVVVEAVARADDGDSDRDHDEAEEKRDRGDKAKGMRRIPNSGMGLSVEEAQNVVQIESESWRHAIDLKIKVPASASLKLSTVNDGDIHVAGVEGELEISNVNGSIQVRGAAATVVANTVNGEVSVTFARLAAFKSMAFSTLNGDIDVSLPAALSADVRLSSDNGEIYSDYEINMKSHVSQPKEERSGRGHYKVSVSKEMHGSIGAGGSELLFKTFNGDIYLRKSK